MARNFAGTTSSYITVALGSLGVAYSGTLAAIMRKTSDGSGATSQHPIAIGGFDDAHTYYFYFDNAAAGNFGFWNGAADSSALTNFFKAVDGWCLVAITKASGTAVLSAHKVPLDGTTPTHLTVSSIANGNIPSAGTTGVGASFGLQKNEAGAFNPFPGDIEIAGKFPTVLTNAEVEALAFNYSAWTAKSPSGLWAFNQSTTATAVSDLSGNGANQNGISGTSVVATPSQFSYGAPVDNTTKPARLGLFTPQLRSDGWF